MNNIKRPFTAEPVGYRYRIYPEYKIFTGGYGI